MSEFNKFCNDLRAKIDEADKGFKDLKASAKHAGQKAKDDAKAHLIQLENKAKAQQAQIKASEAKAKAWIEEKKAVTSDKIADWKSQRQVKKLADYADDAESHATWRTTLQRRQSTKLRRRRSKRSSREVTRRRRRAPIKAAK